MGDLLGEDFAIAASNTLDKTTLKDFLGKTALIKS